MRVIPLVLSSILMAAHFLRTGNIAIVIVILCAPLLLLTKQRWSAIALQIALGIAALEWVRTAFTIASERAATGAPTTRMFVILFCVAAFTAASAVPLRITKPETRN